jgi:hypothetical protein
MSAVASARPCRRTVACVAPFKVVRRDATGAGEKRVVAHATQRDATCDARRSAVLKARGPNSARSAGRKAEQGGLELPSGRATAGVSFAFKSRGTARSIDRWCCDQLADVERAGNSGLPSVSLSCHLRVRSAQLIADMEAAGAFACVAYGLGRALAVLASWDLLRGRAS